MISWQYNIRFNKWLLKWEIVLVNFKNYNNRSLDSDCYGWKLTIQEVPLAVSFPLLPPAVLWLEEVETKSLISLAYFYWKSLGWNPTSIERFKGKSGKSAEFPSNPTKGLRKEGSWKEESCRKEKERLEVREAEARRWKAEEASFSTHPAAFLLIGFKLPAARQKIPFQLPAASRLLDEGRKEETIEDGNWIGNLLPFPDKGSLVGSVAGRKVQTAKLQPVTLAQLLWPALPSQNSVPFEQTNTRTLSLEGGKTQTLRQLLGLITY